MVIIFLNVLVIEMREKGEVSDVLVSASYKVLLIMSHK